MLFSGNVILAYKGLLLFGYFIGFLRGWCPRGGGNWGTLRIPREDGGTLGKIRGNHHPPLRILLSFYSSFRDLHLMPFKKRHCSRHWDGFFSEKSSDARHQLPTSHPDIKFSLGIKSWAPSRVIRLYPP